MRRGTARQRAAALVEIALVWPVALLIVLGTVETAIWSAEAHAAHAASLAGARAGSIAGGTPAVASAIAIRSLSAGLVGARAAAWCPGSRPPAPPVWVCAIDLGDSIEVDVGGMAPALVPIVPGSGIPLHAHAALQKERFTR